MRKRKSQLERREESQQALLIAASQVLIEYGFAATTFERISERAGYSSSLVTSRFGSKDGLFRAIIDFQRARLNTYLASATTSARSGKIQLVEFSAAFLTHLEEDPLALAYYVLLAAALADRLPQRDYFLEQHSAIATQMANLVRRGQDDGCIDPGIDPELAAIGVGCLQLGIAMHLQIDGNTQLNSMKWILRQFECSL